MNELSQKINFLYASFERRLNDPKPHLSEHERELIRITLNGQFNSFKNLFYSEITEAGLCADLIFDLGPIDLPAALGCKVKGGFVNA